MSTRRSPRVTARAPTHSTAWAICSCMDFRYLGQMRCPHLASRPDVPTQSVKLRKKSILLTLRPLAHRNNGHLVVMFSMGNNHDPAPSKTEHNGTSSSPIANESSSKVNIGLWIQSGSINKIRPMFAQICTSLHFVPCALHTHTIHIFMQTLQKASLGVRRDWFNGRNEAERCASAAARKRERQRTL